MKRLVIVLLVVLLVVGAAVLWLASSLDGTVERVIEEVGSDLLRTSVDVGSVSIDLAAGRGTVRDLRIANPRVEGAAFSRTPAIAVGEVSLELDIGSLGSSPVVLERVRLAHPEVNAELRGAALNLDALRRNLAETKSQESAPVADAEGTPIRLRLRRFAFEEGALRLDTDEPESEPRELVLPSFTLQDVGGSRGAPPAEIGRIVLGRILGHAAGRVATKRAQGAAEGWIDEKLEDRPAAADAAKKVLDGLLGGSEE